VLLFVNGCDYSQKKPQVDLGATGAAVERGDARPAASFLNVPVHQTIQSDVIEGSVV
jgi:hypothetical protein